MAAAQVAGRGGTYGALAPCQPVASLVATNRRGWLTARGGSGRTLGWADYQVRSDLAIRRHWVLVWCAFSFCWWHLRHGAEGVPGWLAAGAPKRESHAPGQEAGMGGKSAGAEQASTTGVLAGSVAEGACMARTMAHARAVLAGLVSAAPPRELATFLDWVQRGFPIYLYEPRWLMSTKYR